MQDSCDECSFYFFIFDIKLPLKSLEQEIFVAQVLAEETLGQELVAQKSCLE